MIKELIRTFRSGQTARLKDNLFGGSPTAKTQCFLLSGEKGTGKGDLAAQLRESLDAEGQAVLWVDPARIKEEPDQQKYHNLIPQCIKTNNPILKKRADQAAIEIGREMHRVNNLAEMQASGVATGQEIESPAQVWGKVFKNDFLGLGEDADGNESKAVILVRDFEGYTKNQQLWIKEFLIDQLQESCPADSISFVITTTPGDAKIVKKFFPEDKFNTETLELSPLGESQIEELLLKLSLPEVSVSEFLSHTQGLPGKIADAADALLKEEIDQESISMVQGFLEGCSDEQGAWVTASVHLPECSGEAFRLFFDEENAQKANAWISKSQLVNKGADGQATYNKKLKDALVKWMRQDDPEAFKANNETSAKFTKIVRKFGNAKSRTYLDHLACLNYFSKTDLEFLFNDSAEGYITFVEENPGYFEEGTGKFRVMDEYKKLVHSYRELVPSPMSETLSNRATEFWSDKAADLQRRLANLKAKRSVEEAKLGELLNQRSSLDVFLRHEDEEKERKEEEAKEKAELHRRIQEEKQAEVNRRIKKSRTLHTAINTALIILGVVFFYFGILSKDTAVLPCAFGVCLIAVGIFRPYRNKVTIKTSKIESKVEKVKSKETKAQGKKGKGTKKEEANAEEVAKENTTPKPETPALLDEQSGARYVLEFKREQISSKEEAIQSKIEELSNTLKEVEQMLAEPLVA